MRPALLYISHQAVIPAKAGIQFRNPGFPRIKYGAGLVKPGMTIKVMGLPTHHTNTNVLIYVTPHPPLPLKGGGLGRG